MIEFTEFTEKLNSSELVSHAWDEIDRDQASAGLLIDTISNEFKDWQPPKQLDIIPEFVEKWYNDNIIGTFSGVIASYAFNDNLEAVKWVNKNGGMKLLCKIYLYGYTVEKEKLYILKFPSQLYPYVSEVSVDNGITKQSNFAGSALKLTEKEIKAIDERYWQFAVMVDH